MLLIILTAYALTTDADQKAGEPDPRSGHRQALLLLSKMKDSRDLFRSGTYRAIGRLVKDDPQSGERVEGRIEIFSAFDFDKSTLRFDRTEPIIRHIGDESVPGELMSKIVRTPEFTVTWMNSWQHKSFGIETAVGIHSPDIIFKSPFLSPPIDVRSLGLDLWTGNFKEGTPFKAAYEAWAASRNLEVFPEDHGIYRLQLRQGRSGTFIPQTLWIDEKQGFSPIRLTYSMPGGNPEQPVLESKASWKHVAGVWVPATYHVVVRDGRRGFKRFALTFNWSSLNAAVQPDLFTAEGLDVPEGTAIIDYRPIKPLRVGIIKARE